MKALGKMNARLEMRRRGEGRERWGNIQYKHRTSSIIQGKYMNIKIQYIH